jgi:hypothetical protein
MIDVEFALDPVEFYHFGLRIILSGPTPGPAACRTAIGRAYYAALNRVDAVLARWGVPFGRGPQKHGLAVRYLHATNDPDLKAASADLDELKALRNRADYDMNDVGVENVAQAKRALEYAKELMDYLQVVENDPARRAASEGHIKLYRRKTNTP